MPLSRTFTSGDQQRFAALTGDFNPIHMDPQAARRTQAGAPAVHGIHTLLWLIDELALRNPTLPPIAALKVRFTRIIYVGDQVDGVITKHDESTLRAEARIDGVIMLQLVLTFGPESTEPGPPNASPVPRPANPLDRAIEDMAGCSGTLDLAAGSVSMEQAFPHAARLLGARRCIALGGTSCLVGMVLPGLHSLYAGLSLALCGEANEGTCLQFEVTMVDTRFRLVNMAICGGGLAGTIEAFVRHPPVVQAPYEMVAAHVRNGEFTGAKALIVGGSRGLGELTAKLIASGGGNVIITYATGKSEAESVAAEITARGGQCRAIVCDVRKDVDRQLSALAPSETPTHLYYFATPPIFRGKPGAFSHSLYSDFHDVYVDGFRKLVEFLLPRRPEGLRVLYPSSVALDERPPGMAEYVQSKEAGEALCAAITRRTPQVQITVSRLPRTLTDQTATVQPVAAADPLAVLLPLVRALQV